MGRTIYAQHRAPAPQNSCILNIFIETISIYILGLRRTTHLIDARYKNTKHYTLFGAVRVLGSRVCVCVVLNMRIRLGTGFSILPIVSNWMFANSDAGRYHSAARTGQFNAWNWNRIRNESRCPVSARLSRLTTICHHPRYFENILLACDTLRSTLNFYCVKNHINKHFEQTKINKRMKILVAAIVCQTYTITNHVRKTKTHSHFKVEETERTAIALHRRYCI